METVKINRDLLAFADSTLDVVRIVTHNQVLNYCEKKKATVKAVICWKDAITRKRKQQTEYFNEQIND